MEPVFRFGEIIDLEQILAYDHTVKKERLVLKLENKEIILSEIDGVTVGYLRLEYLWSKYPYIGLIVVRRENQKQGIGKGLLTFLESFLLAQGIDRLYSSSQINEPDPQTWHRHVGFEECGIINGINEGDIGEVFFVKYLNHLG